MTKRTLAALILSLALLVGCTVSTSTSSGGLTISDFKFAEGEKGPDRPEPKFKEGEEVWVLYKVTGFKQGDDKKITIMEDLTVTGPDGKEVRAGKDIALIDKEFEPGANEISAHNNWHMPEGLPSGKYNVKVVLTDKIGQGTTTNNSSFTWEGSGQAAPAGGDEENAGDLKIVGFQFAKEKDGPANEDKKFTTQDKVWMMFSVEGFKMDKEQTVWVQEDLTVTDPEGKPILQKENLVDLKDKNPNNETSVSFSNDVTLDAENPAGTYKVNMTVRDKQGNTAVQLEEQFEVVEGE